MKRNKNNTTLCINPLTCEFIEQKRKAPYPIRLADIYKEKLQKKADAKGIKLHKYVVQILIKHAVK